MSAAETGGAAAETAEACGDCALADGPDCCGGHGVGLLRSDRSVLALAGAVIAVIALAALTVPSSRHVAVVLAGAPTVLVAIVTSVLGWRGLRRRGTAADRAAEVALRLLPIGVAGLLVTVALALVRAVTA